VLDLGESIPKIAVRCWMVNSEVLIRAGKLLFAFVERLFCLAAPAGLCNGA
jgi:hypothetical protein